MERKVIKSGTVEGFLDDINDNFKTMQEAIETIQTNPNVTRTITVSTDTPSGGTNGDIWIVYEE